MPLPTGFLVFGRLSVGGGPCAPNADKGTVVGGADSVLTDRSKTK